MHEDVDCSFKFVRSQAGITIELTCLLTHNGCRRPAGGQHDGGLRADARRGRVPRAVRPALRREWHAWDACNGSENDAPEMFEGDQVLHSCYFSIIKPVWSALPAMHQRPDMLFTLLLSFWDPILSESTFILQLYIVFVVADGGTDLERFELRTLAEAKSILLQVLRGQTHVHPQNAGHMVANLK